MIFKYIKNHVRSVSLCAAILCAWSSDYSQAYPVVTKDKTECSSIVNVPDTPVLDIGVSELTDVANLYFSLYEAYLKASADGTVNMSDIQYLLPPAMALVPAFSGATKIVNELQNLTDDQIKTLLLLSNNYELGAHAQRAKQVLKSVLILAQTYFVYAQASASQ